MVLNLRKCVGKSAKTINWVLFHYFFYTFWCYIVFFLYFCNRFNKYYLLAHASKNFEC